MAMLCPKCGEPLDSKGFCKSCNMSISVYQKIKDTSKVLYNQGLQKAKVRDLSGAIDLLNRSIRLDKHNSDARNLLGLIYFEIGETVSALQQWVICTNLKQDNKDAQYFLDKIQNNQSYLDKLNTAIKKYNQSLAYIDQNSVDLAIIQLKKVISLNPKYVKAYCLLALCYIKEDQKDKARKLLVKVLKIDQSNYIARKYLDALQGETFVDEKVSDKSKDREPGYTGPSFVGKRFNRSSALFQFTSMAIGVAIGLAVMVLLVQPSIIQEKDAEKAVVVSELNDTIGVKEELESKVSKLSSEIEGHIGDKNDLSAELMDKRRQLDETAKLVAAFEHYVVDDLTLAAETLYDIDGDYLSEDTLAVYGTLMSEIYPTVALNSWQDGFNDYRNGRFESGIEKLEIAFKYEKEDYFSDETLYFLARCHYKLGDMEKALELFEQLLEEYPDANNKNDATYYINTIKG